MAAWGPSNMVGRVSVGVFLLMDHLGSVGDLFILGARERLFCYFILFFFC